MYREIPAPGLACLWTATGAASTMRILPDACVDVIWSDVRGAFVAGPDTVAHVHEPVPGERLLGARFHPGTAAAALGLPAAELRDRRVPLDAIAPTLATRLTSDRPAADVLTTLRGLAPAGGDPLVTAAAGALRDPRTRVADLAGALGVAERTLRRRCDAAVGYGPKHLQRVLRLQSFLAQDDEADLARRALDAGYADQAHLTNDCTRLSGLPPAALLRERGSAA